MVILGRETGSVGGTEQTKMDVPEKLQETCLPGGGREDKGETEAVRFSSVGRAGDHWEVWAETHCDLGREWTKAKRLQSLFRDRNAAGTLWGGGFGGIVGKSEPHFEATGFARRLDAGWKGSNSR